ncbi:acyltransferase [Candidatus Harpocratesius sp.]
MIKGIGFIFSIVKFFVIKPFLWIFQKKNNLIIKVRAQSVGKNLHVHRRSYVTKKTILGNNVNFNGMKIIGSGTVKIGNNFHSGEDILIISETHNYDSGSAIPYDSTYIPKTIEIEDNVWLGSRVIVAGNVKIGEGAIIQAGSVVVSDIPKYAIAGGHPAKVFKMRDIKHYEQLKLEKKFH